MQQLGIVINVDHHVAICLTCSSAIVPNALHAHLRTATHNHGREFRQGQRLAFATKDFFERLVKRYKLQDPHLQQPTSIVTAIYGLPVLQGFFYCSKCGYAAQTPTTLRAHRRQVCEGSQMLQGSCQTWFPKSGRQYFAVKTHRHSSPDPLDPVTLIVKQFSMDPYKNIPIQTITHPRDMNIFLTYENWLDEVEGMTGEQIFDIAWNALPKLRQKVRAAVDQYTLELIKKLTSAGPAEQLAMGDYDK